MCSKFEAILWLLICILITLADGVPVTSVGNYVENNKTSAGNVPNTTSVESVKPKRKYKIEIITTKAPKNGLTTTKLMDTSISQMVRQVKCKKYTK